MIGVANAGEPIRIGIHLADCRHHLHVLGPTGTGKSSLLLELILDDVSAGRGVAVFDPPKATSSTTCWTGSPHAAGTGWSSSTPTRPRHRRRSTCSPRPARRQPRMTWPRTSPSVMAKVWARWWGHRTADICHHALLTLAHIDGSTLAHLPRLLSDTAWRAGARARRPGSWSARGRQHAGRVLGRVRRHRPRGAGRPDRPAAVQASPRPGPPSRERPVRHAASTFRFSDILDGGILLARLPKGIIGEDGTRLIGSLLLAGLWQATAARARLPEDQRLDAMVVLDECHNFLHLPIGMDDALAEARGLHTSLRARAPIPRPAQRRHGPGASTPTPATRCYFALAPRDAHDQARHVEPYLDEGDLMRMGGFEVVLRAVAHGRTIPPSTADTIAPQPPIPGRAEQLAPGARARTGLTEESSRRADPTTTRTARPTSPVPDTEDRLEATSMYSAGRTGGDPRGAPQAGASPTSQRGPAEPTAGHAHSERCLATQRR